MNEGPKMVEKPSSVKLSPHRNMSKECHLKFILYSKMIN